VAVEVGVTRVTFDVTPTQPGFHTFRAVVEAARDTFGQNDRADSNTIVKGEPRTLVLAGNDTVATELVAALKSQRQEVDSIVPEALPTDFASLASYDSIVMVDVRLLSDRQPAAPGLRTRPWQAGDGRWTRELRRAATRRRPRRDLPVDMGVRDKQKQPDVALGGHRQVGLHGGRHCNTFNGGWAAVRDQSPEGRYRQGGDPGAAAALTDRDELGVVAFNEAAHWVADPAAGWHRRPPGPIAGPRRRPDQHLRGPRPGGDLAGGRYATRRHIILLTDGWSRSGRTTRSSPR
jgi:hypothetical protein